MTEQFETRRFGLEVKLASGSSDGAFEGYGAVFGNTDSYGDVIAKGAFKDTLSAAKSSGHWPSMLLQHGGWGMSADDMMPVGVWTELDEDAVGLRVSGKLAIGTQRGRDAYELLKMEPRPALSGLSIGYSVDDAMVEYGDGVKAPKRTIKKVRLYEVSLVTNPANDRARIELVKSDDPLFKRTLERILRDAGLSAREAKAFIAEGFKAIAPRDVGAAGDGLLQALRGVNSTFPST